MSDIIIKANLKGILPIRNSGYYIKKFIEEPSINNKISISKISIYNSSFDSEDFIFNKKGNNYNNGYNYGNYGY